MAAKSYTTAKFYGQLAQLVRAFASHAKGHRFESAIVHTAIHTHLFIILQVPEKLL